MKLMLEITFIDNTKMAYASDTWNNLTWTDDLAIIVNKFGEQVAWFPIRNIKSIVAIDEDVG